MCSHSRTVQLPHLQLAMPVLAAPGPTWPAQLRRGSSELSAQAWQLRLGAKRWDKRLGVGLDPPAETSVVRRRAVEVHPAASGSVTGTDIITAAAAHIGGTVATHGAV